MGEVVFPMEKCASWFSSTKWSTLKACTQVTLYGLSRYYSGIHMHTIVITEERNHDLKDSGEGHMGGFGRRKCKGGTVVITL